MARESGPSSTPQPAAQGKEYAQLAMRIREIEAKLQAWFRQNELCRRLAEIPTIGPIGACLTAMKVSDPHAFRCGRDFAARDFFEKRNDEGVVACTEIKGREVCGSNSRFADAYTDEDYARATELRRDLITKHRYIMAIKNVGFKPNVAVYHAETTVLLRAKQENGGTRTSGPSAISMRAASPVSRRAERDQTLAISHYGYVLAKGRVVAAGTLPELADRPEVREAYFG